MVFGCYDPAIDKKGRMAVPAKLREKLGDTFIICRGIFGKRCLCIYSETEWENLVQSIEALPKVKSIDVKRFLYDGPFEVAPDSQGSFLIPASLRDFANLTDEVHIIGMGTNLELWNPNAWKEESEKSTPETIADIMLNLEF